MARITVEDCLGHVDNRFQLVVLAARRARQLAFGSRDALVPWEDDKPTVVALREIALGYVTPALLKESDEPKPLPVRRLSDMHPIFPIEHEQENEPPLRDDEEH